MPFGSFWCCLFWDDQKNKNLLGFHVFVAIILQGFVWHGLVVMILNCTCKCYSTSPTYKWLQHSLHKVFAASLRTLETSRVIRFHRSEDFLSNLICLVRSGINLSTNRDVRRPLRVHQSHNLHPPLYMPCVFPYSVIVSAKWKCHLAEE